ncbi:MAG: hypothetical protein M2R45_05369 [Verrucomicrobia subdivision 3 bacterium]|nr:hypothetical protein [Limisphaerales bacterium]MCS1417775.1 hypothetical protein [Limisphaerales bacterium]
MCRIHWPSCFRSTNAAIAANALVGTGERCVTGQIESNGFEVFLTSDWNLGYQQNLAKRTVDIVVLPTNHWPLSRDHSEEIDKALETLEFGSFIELQF